MTTLALATSAAAGTSAQPGRLVVWLLAFAGAASVLLAPALWNGFPFMFYDSGTFIELAVNGGFRPERSAFYAAFLAAFWPRFSLWPAMAAQVLITVLVIAVFARRLQPGLSPARFFVLIVALSLGTNLPWNAAEILPDILAPLMVLCLYLLGFHSAALSLPQKAALIAVATYGATAHASHLGLAAGLAIVVAAMQIATRPGMTASASPRWGLPALVFAMALLAVVANNFTRTGAVFVSRSGPAFVVGRLIQDGIAKRLLDDTCPQSGFRLCAYKDNLPDDGNDYLWGRQSPFRDLGGFAGTQDESLRIIGESLKRYPLLQLKMAVLDMADQFAAFDSGDGIEPLNDTPVAAMTRSAPGQVAGYSASRQQNGQIGFRRINAVQAPIGALSIAALSAILLRAGLRRHWDDRVFLPLFMLLALLGNAFICGALSGAHDRYQSRLIWPASLAVLLLAARQPPRPVAGAPAIEVV